MIDKNGKEIKTGDIVQVTGAYFKNDNAIYFVSHSPGDYGWNGEFYSMTRISKRGKISTAKYRLCFWPIAVFVNNHDKNILASKWNKEHAKIEIIDTVPLHEVKSYFEAKVAEAEKIIKWEHSHNYDYETARLKDAKESKEHYEKITARIIERMQ